MHEFAKNGLVPLVLRLGLGVIFIYHGLEKVSPEHQWGAAWSNDFSMGLQVATAWAELLCGFALLAGYLTRLAAAGGGGITTGAIYFIHGKYGFGLQTGDAFKQGFEYKFALLVMCAAVLLTGGGTLAVDWFVRTRAAKPSAVKDPPMGEGPKGAEELKRSGDARPALAGKS